MGAKLYPAYKDSGVEWIGDIPEHWEVSAVKHVFTVVNGSTPKSEVDAYWDGDIEWITPIELGNCLSFLVQHCKRKITHAGLASCGTKLVPIGSIILSTRAPIGLVGVADRPLCTNQGCKALISTERALPSFFAFLLHSCTTELNHRGNGTTFIELSTRMLRSMPLAFPPLQEQKQIAAFLDRETSKIDTLIGKQKQLINLLKEKRGSLISHTVTKGLNPNVPMKDSGVEWIGEIPEHWEVKRVKNLLRESFGSVKCGPFGSDLKNDEMTSEGIPVFNQRVVIDNNFSDFQYNITDAKFEAMRPFEAFPGDILITTRGTIGKVCTIPNDAPRGILHPCVMRLQVDTSKVDCGWFVTFLRDENVFKSQLLVMSNATTIEVIYQNNLVSVFVPFPPLQEQKQISSFLDAETSKIDALIEKANQSIALLKERRSSLISAAVTGKIDVRGVA